MVQELPEEVELLRRELDFVVPDHDLTPTCVNAQIAVLEARALELATLRIRASQDRFDPGNELAGIERFREVIVGADLEPDDLVDVIVAGRQHEDRDVRALANPSADVDSVQVGKHQVEHDQRWCLGRRLLDRALARSRNANGEAGPLEVHGDEGSDALLVLHDEDRVALSSTHDVTS